MNKKSGYIAILGRPNVGKSTLLNKFLGQKISITSRKPQTTRHQILGIRTIEDTQILFVDTPGIHKTKGRELNKAMNKNALSVIHGVDVILFVIEALNWREADQWILDKFSTIECPVILVVNKIDYVKNKAELLPFIEEVKKHFDFKDIILISAKSGADVKRLEKELVKLLPAREFLYDEAEITDRSMRFMAAEMIREKVFRLTGEELPYSTAVEIDQYQETPKITNISATIFVDRPGQKIILIGSQGAKMKLIGQQARIDIEKLLGTKVFLRLWVKVKKGWADDNRALQSLGYSD